MLNTLDRRTFLRTSTISATSVALVSAVSAADPSPTRRMLLAGGGVFDKTQDRALLKYFLQLIDKPDPIVYLLPTAAGDNLERIAIWYETMHTLPCRPRHLRLFGPTGQLKDFGRQLLSADGIFVHGGNTLNMLAVWRAQGVDTILRTAWERGIVLAGESAGMICWFEQGVTDSRPERLSGMDCLGWLKGSACPHYHTEPLRRPGYRKLLLDNEVQAGIACDDHAALVYEGDRLVKVVSAHAKATAYRVRREGQEIVEEPFTAELLPGVKVEPVKDAKPTG